VAIALALAAWAAAAAPNTPEAEPGLRITQRSIGQPVEARSLDELITALRGDGGHARTRVTYEQEAELAASDDGRCAPRGLQLRVDIEVLLPVWAGEPPPPRVAETFQRIAEALRVHEEGHVALALEEAKRTHAALSAARPFVDCREARRFLLREQLQFERRLRWRNARYDRQTAHGAHQGAVILRPKPSRPPPSARPLR
jgi:predicted secreted Zn-dependent protease